MQISRPTKPRLALASIARLALASITVVSISFALAACAVHPTYAPDGRRGFVISCGGFLNSWSSCLVKAGRACGNRGYDTIKGSEEDRSMMVACKLPNAQAAPP